MPSVMVRKLIPIAAVVAVTTMTTTTNTVMFVTATAAPHHPLPVLRTTSVTDETFLEKTAFLEDGEGGNVLVDSRCASSCPCQQSSTTTRSPATCSSRQPRPEQQTMDQNDHIHHQQCYYLFEWTSSTGIICFLLLSYCSLIAIIHSIAVYKFIATWYLITGSLREQQYYTTLRCLRLSLGAAGAGITTTRRRTCQEALIVIPYQSPASLDSSCYNSSSSSGSCSTDTDDSPHCTKLDPSCLPAPTAVAATSACCPVCLMDLQERELVTQCDGCTATFHKDCLFEWLDYNSATSGRRSHFSPSRNQSQTSCPCCRKELLEIACCSSSSTSSSTTTAASAGAARSNGWLTDMSTFMGYYTR